MTPTIESAVVDYVEGDEPLGTPSAPLYPCIRCGGEVGDPLTEQCEACLEPDPDCALYLEDGR